MPPKGLGLGSTDESAVFGIAYHCHRLSELTQLGSFPSAGGGGSGDADEVGVGVGAVVGDEVGVVDGFGAGDAEGAAEGAGVGDKLTLCVLGFEGLTGVSVSVFAPISQPDPMIVDTAANARVLFFIPRLTCIFLPVFCVKSG